jgi:hypothetical protein
MSMPFRRKAVELMFVGTTVFADVKAGSVNPPR